MTIVINALLGLEISGFECHGNNWCLDCFGKC